MCHYISSAIELLHLFALTPIRWLHIVIEWTHLPRRMIPHQLPQKIRHENIWWHLGWLLRGMFRHHCYRSIKLINNGRIEILEEDANITQEVHRLIERCITALSIIAMHKQLFLVGDGALAGQLHQFLTLRYVQIGFAHLPHPFHRNPPLYSRPFHFARPQKRHSLGKSTIYEYYLPFWQLYNPDLFRICMTICSE